MIELPGLNSQGDLKKDLDQVRRYLNRLVPQLEKEIQALQVDGYTSALNERREGLTDLTGAGKATTTAAAVAEHILDTNNPHGVTLRQLGYTEPQAQVYETEDGLVVALGGLVLAARTVPVSGTGEAAGAVYALTVALGDWPVPFDEIYAMGAQLRDVNGWAGALTGTDGETCGSVTIYTPAAEAAEGTIQLWAIGRISDGEQ